MRYIVFLERGERKEVCEKGAEVKWDAGRAWCAAGIVELDAGRGTEDAGKLDADLYYLPTIIGRQVAGY